MKYCSFLFCLFLLTPCLLASELSLRYSKVTDTEEATPYIKELLNLVWENTRNEGPVSLVPSKAEMVQERALQVLREGKELDLFWTMTSKDREKDLRIIRIPLLRGMLGHRIFIIKKSEKARFDELKNIVDKMTSTQEKRKFALAELQKITMGQGHDWPDTKILEHSNFNVVKSSNYKGLFPMLKANRFIAFPRGINEPWGEIENYLNEDFVVESHFCIAYPAPLYFMVNKGNEALAKRLEKGLTIAMANGSFERVFKKYWGQYLEKAKMKDRMILWIENPYLSEETKKSFKSSPIVLKY